MNQQRTLTLTVALLGALASLGSSLSARADAPRAAAAPTPNDRVPSDERLAPVRDRLQALVTKANDERLPSEVLVAKVQEGLAKNVDAARIVAACDRLYEGLVAARTFARETTGRAPSPALVAALAKARLAGVELGQAKDVLTRTKDDTVAAHGVSVLTDLSARGYPGRSASLVGEVAAREPASMGRVIATLESLRREQSLTPLEAVESLQRSLVASSSLEVAARRSSEEAGRGAQGRGKGRADEDADDRPGRGLGLGRGKGDDHPGRGRDK